MIYVQVLGPMVSKGIGPDVVNRLCEFEVQVEVVDCGVANLDEQGWSFIRYLPKKNPDIDRCISSQTFTHLTTYRGLGGAEPRGGAYFSERTKD